MFVTVFMAFTLSFADGTGTTRFVPKRASVGTWGSNGQSNYYWVLSPSTTYYCLGLITDAAAKQNMLLFWLQ
jgi:hypothetical protein